MQRRLNIAIVGYGAAGQAASLFLSDQGHALSVFEQASSPGPVGAGFLLQPTGLRVLSRLGLSSRALAVGQRIDRLYGCNASGRCVMDMRYADHLPGCFGLGMSRGSLFTVLRDAWRDAGRLHAGVRVESIGTDGRHLIDGEGHRHGPFDLIVVGDGAHSRLREATPARVKRQRIYPWGAMWCLLPADGWQHPSTLQQRYHGAREMIGLLPVGQRADCGGRWLTFFFSLPGEHVDGFDADALTRMRERIRVLWPEVMPLLHGMDDPARFHRARYRDVVLGKPIGSNVIFIGDAAHAMSPQLGQGVNMALLDAEALADALAVSAHVDEALLRYQQTRRSHLAIYQQLSRWLTPLFQSDHGSLARLRDTCFGPLTRGQMLKVLTGTKRAWWR